MPAKREYRVKGTNDFIVLAGIFFFLCLWAVKDAWFPSDKVMKKHPQEINVAFELDGAVEKVNVDVGESISEHQVLANLRTDRLSVEFDEAKETYAEAKKTVAQLEAASNAGAGPGEGSADIKERLAVAKKAVAESLARVDELRDDIAASELKSPSKGEILKVRIVPHTMVEAGQTAFVIDPKDHFYLFNKSLTVLSFLLFWVFLAIHVLAR